MTVCIAALCDDGRGVVLASDRMVTAHIPIGYEFEHEPATKIVKLLESPLVQVLLSGDVLRGHEVVGQARTLLTQQRGPVPVAEAAEFVRSCYQEIRRVCIIRTELEPRGLDLIQFYNNHQQLIPVVVQAIDHALSSSDLNVEMLIAGANGPNHAIYSVVNPGIVRDHSAIGHGAIGSGAPHALYSLIEDEYRSSMPKDQVIELIKKAKTRSEVAPGVGKQTTIVAIPNEEPDAPQTQIARTEMAGSRASTAEEGD